MTNTKRTKKTTATTATATTATATTATATTATATKPTVIFSAMGFTVVEGTNTLINRQLLEDVKHANFTDSENIMRDIVKKYNASVTEFVKVYGGNNDVTAFNIARLTVKRVKIDERICYTFDKVISYIPYTLDNYTFNKFVTAIDEMLVNAEFKSKTTICGRCLNRYDIAHFVTAVTKYSKSKNILSVSKSDIEYTIGRILFYKDNKLTIDNSVISSCKTIKHENRIDVMFE